MNKTKLANLLKEKKKTVINEGLFVNTLAQILKFFYSNKTKDIIKQIEPMNKNLAQSLDELKQATEKVDLLLQDPKIQQMLKSYNIDVSELPRPKRR